MQGSFSEPFEVANSVLQGAVLGPPLWNAFFVDVAEIASASGGIEQMFAADLSVCCGFDRSASLATCRAEMDRYKYDAHKCDAKNRVTFDAGKVHILILHPSTGRRSF